MIVYIRSFIKKFCSANSERIFYKCSQGYVRKKLAYRIILTSHKLELKDQLSIYARYKLAVQGITADDESGIAAGLENINGPPLISFPSGKHDAVVEAKIRRVKENVRAIAHSVPYKMGRKLLAWAVQYGTYVTNLMPGPYAGVSPREALTGVKPDYKKVLPAEFGSFVQMVERDDAGNSMNARTSAAIVVLPTGTGAVKVLSLVTGKERSTESFTEI